MKVLIAATPLMGQINPLLAMRPRAFGPNPGTPAVAAATTAPCPAGGAPRERSRWPRFIAAFLSLALTAMSVCAPAFAQSSSMPGAPSDPSSESLRTLADLLDDPGVRAWLRERARDVDHASQARAQPAGAQHMMATGLDETRTFLRDLAAAVPRLPASLDVARARLTDEFRERGLLAILLPLVAFATLGFLVEMLFWRATARLRRRMIAAPLAALNQRLKALGLRTLYGFGVVGAYTAGSVGAFLALDWPPLLQHIVLAYLLVFLAVRLTVVVGRVVLAPGAERFRVIPLATPAASYWFRRSALLVGLFSFIKATLDLLALLGVDAAARTLLGLGLGLVLLAVTLATIWGRPAADGRALVTGARDGLSWLLSIYLVSLWLSTVAGAAAPFSGIVLLLLALANLGLRAAVQHLLVPHEPDVDTSLAEGGGRSTIAARPIAVVALDRGLRIAFLVGAGLVVARIFDVDPAMLTASDTPTSRALRAILNVAVIALLTELAWQVARAWIDRLVGEAGAAGDMGSDEVVRRRQRLRTLLPILRNVLLFVLVAVAVLMALSALGIEIGPLIAGAGVVGIAVGFGAQTLVKDVISGMFFIFDDAFRVGEYIESGSVKGTVEAFSLRSVKLRHHRGPLHTVPFGALSTITNYSRDWVIDKMTLGLSYDTDLNKVKKIVKDIGRTLLEDPEVAPHILETLKMQGVDAFGDFAIKVRLKMMTRPGEQFTIRRRANALIKQRFETEGVRFAYPTVTVAGGSAVEAAAALGVQPQGGSSA